MFPMHVFGAEEDEPLRQIEAAELMVAMNKYTISYARSLLAATPQDQLVEKPKPKLIEVLRDEQMALMERELASLEREFKMAEQSYGTDHLDLVLTKGYLGKLLGQRAGRAIPRAASSGDPGRISEVCRNGAVAA